MEQLGNDLSVETKGTDQIRERISWRRFRLRHLFYVTALTMVSFPLIDEAIEKGKKIVSNMPNIQRAHKARAAADDGNNDYIDMLRVRHELVSADLHPWMAGFSQRGLLRDFKQAIKNDIADYEKRGIRGETDANIYHIYQSTLQDFENRLVQPLPDDWLVDEKRRQATW